MTPGVRHNLVALGVDHAVFMLGLSFASQATILPAFAAHLGAPNVVIGAIPAVMTLGWFLPSLFAAGHEVKGPAIFESATTTVLAREGERVTVTRHGWLDIRIA